MAQPLIGITSMRSLRPQGYTVVGMVEAYSTALARQGACPVLIPVDLPEDALQSLLDRVDGLLFSGGGDVHPNRYGGEEHPLVSAVDEDRDRVEIHLARAAAEVGIPFLGICRGLQLLNVALGGTLYEDILAQRPESIPHDRSDGNPRNFLAHPVRLSAGSRLAALWGLESIEVNSLHHQGIRDLAPALHAVGHSPDGLVETIELPGHPFGLAVQWHPEWLQEQLAMRQLFRVFVQAVVARNG